MSDPTTNTNPWGELNGEEWIAIACTPANWASYEQMINSDPTLDGLFADFSYESDDYPGMIFARGSSVNLTELAWLDEHGFIVEEGFSFLRSNLPSTFM